MAEHHTVCALPAAARVLAAALVLFARVLLLLLLTALWLADDPPITVEMLARDFAALVIAPELCARLVRRAFSGTARVESGQLVVQRGGRRFEVPCASVATVTPWRLPLPLPGLSPGLVSGARFPARLGTHDPSPLLADLAAAGVAAAGGASAQPAVRFASARARLPRRWYDTVWCKVVLFALLPGGVGFYAHQHIAYGGFLGEYYLMGPGAWLGTAGEYWLTGALYLALWAGLFHIATELFLWAAAHASPETAGGARRIAARAATLLFYVSVPALLAARFLA